MRARRAVCQVLTLYPPRFLTVQVKAASFPSGTVMFPRLLMKTGIEEERPVGKRKPRKKVTQSFSMVSYWR